MGLDIYDSDGMALVLPHGCGSKSRRVDGPRSLFWRMSHRRAVSGMLLVKPNIPIPLFGHKADKVDTLYPNFATLIVIGASTG